MGRDATASGGYGSIAMGYHTTASGGTSTAMGGVTTASGALSTAIGYDTTASGLYSTAMGGRTTASGYNSTAMGLYTTASGTASIAMGAYASTTESGGTPRDGTFVWGDYSTSTPVRPTAHHQFVARASGGAIFYSNSGMSTGVTLAAGGGSWASVSDRERKRDFAPVDGDDILARVAALPVTSWSYRDDTSGRRYIGPVAQDFHAAFGLGDDETIATLDVDGVTLAAIKALEQRGRELERENAALRDGLGELRKELDLLRLSISEK
jgi:trimeric autotransporter adhesin